MTETITKKFAPGTRVESLSMIDGRVNGRGIVVKGTAPKGMTLVYMDSFAAKGIGSAHGMPTAYLRAVE
jgi:hypothetical protein